VSTATPVPETRGLDGDDARKTLRTCGSGQLLRDAFVRLRVADGFSHARSMAYVTALVLVEALVSLVGLATALGSTEVSGVIVRTLKAAAPGPAGDFLTQAVTQAHQAGATHRYAGLVFGLLATLISGSTLLGQLERGFNRIYGIEQDRPTLRKYGLALGLTVSAGVLAAIAFAALAFGRTIGDSIHNDTVSEAWALIRWPLALVLLTGAMTLLLRWSPRRRQPDLSWLAFGATVSVLLWALCTIGLGAFFSLSTSFGETYGPLAGIIALLVWALLSAVSILFGGATAAQLEAIRVGVDAPQDEEKVDHSEPRNASRAVAGARG
jgi:YihY family inner membrane protein